MQIVLPTSFFPSIAYCHAIANAQRVIIDVHEHYVKQNLRNRCQIYSANGALDLIVPVVKGRSPQVPTHAIEIANHENWQTKHWRSIEAAYRSSPYLEYYEDELRTFFEKEFTNLVEYNKEILQNVLDLIGINVPIEYSSEYVEGNNWQNYRYLCAKKRPQFESSSSYFQVFQEKGGFIPNLSILDLLFCEGPNAINYLQ